MLPLPSRIDIEPEHGNAQHGAPIAVAAFRSCSDSSPLGGLPRPLQPTAIAFISPPKPYPLLFIHYFGITPSLPYDIASVAEEGGVLIRITIY